MKNKKLIIESFIRVAAIAIYFYVLKYFAEQIEDSFGEAYLLSFTALLIGFSLSAFKTLLVKCKTAQTEGYFNLFLAFVINLPIAFAIFFNLLFPVVNQFIKFFEPPYDRLFSLAVFFRLGWGIDPHYNLRKIFDVILNYCQKILNVFKR